MSEEKKTKSKASRKRVNLSEEEMAKHAHYTKNSFSKYAQNVATATHTLLDHTRRFYEGGKASYPIDVSAGKKVYVTAPYLAEMGRILEYMIGIAIPQIYSTAVSKKRASPKKVEDAEISRLIEEKKTVPAGSVQSRQIDQALARLRDRQAARAIKSGLNPLIQVNANMARFIAEQLAAGERFYAEHSAELPSDQQIAERKVSTALLNKNFTTTGSIIQAIEIYANMNDLQHFAAVNIAEAEKKKLDIKTTNPAERAQINAYMHFDTYGMDETLAKLITSLGTGPDGRALFQPTIVTTPPNPESKLKRERERKSNRVVVARPPNTLNNFRLTALSHIAHAATQYMAATLTPVRKEIPAPNVEAVAAYYGVPVDLVAGRLQPQDVQTIMSSTLKTLNDTTGSPNIKADGPAYKMAQDGTIQPVGDTRKMNATKEARQLMLARNPDPSSPEDRREFESRTGAELAQFVDEEMMSKNEEDWRALWTDQTYNLYRRLNDLNHVVKWIQHPTQEARRKLKAENAKKLGVSEGTTKGGKKVKTECDEIQYVMIGIPYQDPSTIVAQPVAQFCLIGKTVGDVFANARPEEYKRASEAIGLTGTSVTVPQGSGGAPTGYIPPASGGPIGGGGHQVV